MNHPTVTYQGHTHSLHQFFFDHLPYVIRKQSKVECYGLDYQLLNPKLEELAKEVHAAIKPHEGKKTKTPYEDALWDAGYAIEVSRSRSSSSLGKSVYIQHRQDSEKRILLNMLGDIRGFVEEVEKLLHRIEQEKAKHAEMMVKTEEERSREQATIYGIDFTPLTTVGYWRSLLYFGEKSGGQYDLRPSELRYLVRLLDQRPEHYPEQLRRDIRKAILALLDEVGIMQNIVRSGAWGQIVKQLAAGADATSEEVVKLLTQGAEEVQEVELVEVG